MHYAFKRASLLIAIPLFLTIFSVQAKNYLSTFDNKVISVDSSGIKQVQKINNTTFEVLFQNDQRLTIDFYSNSIFRLFQDPKGGILRSPIAKPAAEILVKNPRKQVDSLRLSETKEEYLISSSAIELKFNKQSGLLSVNNKKTSKTAVEFISSPAFDKNKTQITLAENKEEYFYGGGVQNGRFSHKGKIIAIENQNSWTDGGVASPTPFYWSTAGYGILFYTFNKGKYDFGAKEKGKVNLSHEMNYLDAFIMINDGAIPLLQNFYQLTGNPVLLPKFGFYQGHLNAYNRDYWKENEKGILFEDGKRYKEEQKDNGGTKESLNGEKGNYQFSARAVIDRYQQQDMPLGWILPNDGYGAGYGQTESLNGNIENLKSFGEYARKKGVEIGLWTQSDLHPKDSISALLQRDIVKEVRDAGVRVLKTDVAWVGPGYSFGLNGIADVAQIMPYYGQNARPFIISLDGWAGTQRYAGIWSGDQTSGTWEYIRFHIPTYIGSGLSGQPNITSDMDGIFGGKNLPVNVRDYQWKTFTPMELNMDGWGANEKYPHALGEPATSINRNYLKLKSTLMPYAYSIAHESISGYPMVRAMFLEYPNPYSYGKSTQYQFMYGPSFLVAPIYQNTKADKEGNDIRHGIYLPEGNWIDYFSGEQYEGNRIINDFQAPLWKLPVFVKAGAIIPLTKAHNNVMEMDKAERILEFYPSGTSTFTLYDDDGTTEAYRYGAATSTKIESILEKDKLTINVAPSQGTYEGMPTEVSTVFIVNTTQKAKRILAKVGKKKIKLQEVHSLAALVEQENVYFYDASPNLNRFATKDSSFAKTAILKTPQIYIKVQQSKILEEAIQVELSGYAFNSENSLKKSTGVLSEPKNAQVKPANLEAYKLMPTWDTVADADYYEILFQDMLYSTIQDTSLLFEDLEALTNYQFKVRAVNKDGHSAWSSFDVKTKSNPLEFAIQGAVASSSAKDQGGFGIDKMLDFDENSQWHSKYSVKAVPFEFIVDLKTFIQLDKFHYLPRKDSGNGTITKGKVYYSLDQENWTDAGEFTWKRDGEAKVFGFGSQPTVRYIKIAVTEAVGNYGSGQELYIFKVPGTESYIPGDINNDKKLDRNDLISYTNYIGLRQGDSDFEGYISAGDINKNGLIDAFDVSTLTTQLEEAVTTSQDSIAGSIQLILSKESLNANEILEIKVLGNNLKDVNALSFALPYANQDFEFLGLENVSMLKMENLTKDRLHSNGTKALYPLFANVGEQETISGNKPLFTIKLKTKRALKFNLKSIDGFLVDKNLKVIKF